VDIVFLLLVFFLVATTYRDDEKDLTIKLPSASNTKGGPEARLKRVLVNVRSDGTIILEKRPVSREELYRALVEARRANPNVPVFLRGDLSATHGEIVSVLDLCRRARVRVAVAVTPRRDGVGQEK
jgi:biopolymer transport protein ExbD